MKRISIPLLIALIPALFMTATYPVKAQLPSDPDLVYVRMTAMSTDNGRVSRPTIGLHKEDLKVFEDNKPQDIVYFSQEDIPLHVGILLDASGTTKDDLKAKVLPLLIKSGGRDDEFFMVEAGKSPLNDAVLQMINTLEQRGNNRKRALVLLTTRSDPGAYSFAKVRDRLKDLDIQLYVTALQASSDISNDSSRQDLRELAEQSGGDAFFLSSMYEQADVCKKIMAQLKNQYLLGFRSTNRAADGKWRRIKITGEYLDTKAKKVKKIDVHAKPGYYARTAAK